MQNKYRMTAGTTEPCDNPIPEAAESFIERRAASVCRKPRFATHEQSDLEQLFRTAVWRALPRFDPKRGSLVGFCLMVVDRTAISEIRRRLGPKQSAAPAPMDLESTALQSSIAVHHTWDQVDVAIDVATLLDQLPDELREVCRVIAQHPVRRAAKILGIDPSTLQRRKKRIRAICEDLDLD